MKTFILAFIAFFASSFCYAQEYTTDVVYLKNGSIIRGLIIEQVPNQSLKIKTSDGSLFVFNLSEIEKMTKEQPVTATTKPIAVATNVYKDYEQGYNQKPDWKHQKNALRGYKGFIDWGYTFASDDESRIDFNTSHGYQFNNYLFLGAGAGYHYYNDAELYTIPVFVNFRANFTNMRITPFCDVRAGYSYGDLEGAYSYIGVGIRLGIGAKKKDSITFAIGYSYQEYDYYYNYGQETTDTSGFNLKMGVEF